ncbi:MAG: hypothetical protein IJP98_04935 [Clostridia bacterium]|nr:hypothetical protein [Clostridia bacterium]
MERTPLEKSLRRRSWVLLIVALHALLLPALMVFILYRVARTTPFRILLNPDGWAQLGTYFVPAFILTGGVVVAGILMIALGCISWRGAARIGRAARKNELPFPLAARITYGIGLLAFILGFLVLTAGLILVLIVLVVLGTVLNFGG